MAGGLPISRQNMRDVRALTERYGVRVILDATRILESAYFIQEREVGQSERPTTAIVRDLCALSDGCTMSAKKDPLANIGGFLAVNDGDAAELPRNLLVIYHRSLRLPRVAGLPGRMRKS